MKTPQDSDHSLSFLNQIIVRYEYKKTSGVISEKANDDPEKSTVC
jgi:hypothetical protein